MYGTYIRSILYNTRNVRSLYSCVLIYLQEKKRKRKEPRMTVGSKPAYEPRSCVHRAHAYNTDETQLFLTNSVCAVYDARPGGTTCRGTRDGCKKPHRWNSLSLCLARPYLVVLFGRVPENPLLPTPPRNFAVILAFQITLFR